MVDSALETLSIGKAPAPLGPNAVWYGASDARQPHVIQQAEQVVAAHLQKKPESEASTDIFNDYSHRNDEALTSREIDVSGIKDPQAQERLLNHLRAVDEEFDYMAHTRDIEIGTQRTQVLQNIVDKMTKKRGISARVVIMNRGTSPDAFVMPDRTIFISQSMMNALDSLDEVGHVLAHEVNHILLKTWKRRIESSGLQSLAVPWSHELAADFTQDLMHDANLNSFYGAFASEKISAATRGDAVHQTGTTRSTINTATHRGIHSPTSTNELTPIPEILRTLSVRPTNSERMWACASKEDVDGLGKIIPKLHPRDLFTMYDWRRGIEDAPWNQDVRNSISNLIMTRLFREGVSRSDMRAFLYCVDFEKTTKDIVTTDQAFFEATDAIEAMTEETYEHLHRLAFGSAGELSKTGMTATLTKRAEEYYEQYGKDMPDDVRDQNVVELAARLQKIEAAQKHGSDFTFDIRGGNPIHIIVSNIYTHYLKPPREDRIDYLFRSLHGRGVPVDRAVVRNVIAFYGLSHERNLSPEDIDRITAAFDRYWPEQVPRSPEAVIEGFFSTFQTQVDMGIKATSTAYAQFLAELRASIPWDMPDEQRMQYAQQVRDRLQSLSFPVRLDREDADFLHTKEQIVLIRYGLGLQSGLGIFESDGDSFYEYIDTIMRQSHIEPEQLSFAERIALVYPLLVGTNRGSLYASFESWRGSLPIKDFTRLEQLPFVRSALQLPEKAESVPDFKALLGNKHTLTQPWMHIFRDVKDLDRNLFVDKMSDLLDRYTERIILKSLLQGSVMPTDYEYLHKYVQKRFPPGPERSQITENICKAIVRSPDLPWDYRLRYVTEHIHDFSLEDVNILAKEIHDIPSFVSFREKLLEAQEQVLSGSKEVGKLAALDNFFAWIMKDYKVLLESTNPANAENLTTRLATQWFSSVVMGWGLEDATVTPWIYDDKRQQVLSGGQRVFLSFSDMVTYLHQLSSDQRVGIVLKSLTDEKGLLMSSEGRSFLADTAISVTGASGFTADALRAACMEADAKYIAFPVAQMLAPSLFRAFDANAASIDKLSSSEVGYTMEANNKVLSDIMTRPVIDSLLHRSTRELMALGAQYQKYPNSRFAALAADCEADYRIAIDRLNILFPKPKISESTLFQSNHEGLMRGMEMIGAPATRGLQLASQLLDLDPQTEARFAQAADANPGLNSFLFWENLYRHTQNDPKLAAFLDNHEFILDQYIGGGSLFTTFKGSITLNGVKRKVAVRMRNPNAATFVVETHKQTQKIFSRVAAGHPEHKDMVDISLDTADLSQEWCLEDINDPTFTQDDAVFRQHMGRYSPKDPNIQVYIPEIYFNSDEVKIEELAEGRTTNQLLHDPSVALSTKQRVVKELEAIAAYQINKSVKTTSGSMHYIHSDPQTGNYVVEVVGDHLRVAIIDRNMFLKATPKAVSPFRHLAKGERIQFVSGFLDVILNENNVRNPIDRMNFLQRVLRDAATTGSEGDQSDVVAIQKLLRSIRSQGYTIPLWTRLMLRNIGLNKRLVERHVVS